MSLGMSSALSPSFPVCVCSPRTKYIVCFKSDVDDIIPPLPKTFLPEPKCKIGLGTESNRFLYGVIVQALDANLRLLKHHQPSQGLKRQY